MTKNDAVERALKPTVAADRCPKCSGDLDTGWECNKCGFDAMPIAISKGEA